MRLKYGGKSIKLAGEIHATLHFSKFYQAIDKLTEIRKNYPRRGEEEAEHLFEKKIKPVMVENHLWRFYGPKKRN